MGEILLKMYNYTTYIEEMLYNSDKQRREAEKFNRRQAKKTNINLAAIMQAIGNFKTDNPFGTSVEPPANPANPGLPPRQPYKSATPGYHPPEASSPPPRYPLPSIHELEDEDNDSILMFPRTRKPNPS